MAVCVNAYAARRATMYPCADLVPGRCSTLCRRGAPPCAVTLCRDLVPQRLSKIGSPTAFF